jgi:L-2,4-diaminobutyrate decarboxylase
MSIETLRTSFTNPFQDPSIMHVLNAILRDVFQPVTPVSPPTTYEVSLSNSSQRFDIATVLSDVRACVVQQSLYPYHPHALGHMVPPPASISVVADLIIGAMNQCAFIWEEAPMAHAIEAEVISWLGTSLGFGKEAGGLITSGGTMSNILATYLALCRWRRSGSVGSPCILASDQAHVSLEKGAAMNGLPKEAVIRIPTNNQGRLSNHSMTRALQEVIRSGKTPVMVVSTAGTTNAGTLEPFPESIAATAPNAWCHIDAAHGGFMCLLSDELTTDSPISRWRKADSVSWDPHKGLYASYAVGALLVRDRSVLEAFRFNADYALKMNELQDSGTDHIDGSRRFEALKVWMILRHFGRDGICELVSYGCRLARLFSEWVNNSSSFSLLTFPDTNIVCFRFTDDQFSPAASDQFNEAIKAQLFLTGGPLLSSTRVDGRVFLRAVFQNPNTTTDDLERAIKRIEFVARHLEAEENSTAEVFYESVPSD